MERSKHFRSLISQQVYFSLSLKVIFTSSYIVFLGFLCFSFFKSYLYTPASSDIVESMKTDNKFFGLTMVLLIFIPAAPYMKLKDGEQCSKSLQRITSESTCKDAAEKLELNWGSTYRFANSSNQIKYSSPIGRPS